MHNLEKHFGKADLPLLVEDKPFANRNADIFQMDVRKVRNKERFRLYEGHESNQVLVQGVDKGLRQLVLYVREPRRAFEVEHRIGGGSHFGVQKEAAIEAIKARGNRVLRTDNRRFVVEEQFTTDSKRHYLCGHDESHLFIALLPRAVSTVSQAHDVLMAPQAQGKDAKRQGEWFFIELTSTQMKVVEHMEGEGKVVRNMSLRNALHAGGFFGRPQKDVRKMMRAHQHVAEEVITVPPELKHGDYMVYARGKIRHVDHKTINLPTWHRVALNRETVHRDPSARPLGIAWID